MNKIAIVYWSGTGNTAQMAEEIKKGALNSGSDVTVFEAAAFAADMMDDYDRIAFGCSAMGAEELEETEFSPMFNSCIGKLGGKQIALFGSYGWGDGEWMRNWAADCADYGAVMVSDYVICADSPDNEAVEQCQALGAALAA